MFARCKCDGCVWFSKMGCNFIEGTFTLTGKNQGNRLFVSYDNQCLQWSCCCAIWNNGASGAFTLHTLNKELHQASCTVLKLDAFHCTFFSSSACPSAEAG